MSTTQGSAAPASGTDPADEIPDFATLPTFADLATDPEIAALLDFDPVPRKLQKTNGWNAAMQRLFIAWLAHYGSPGKAAEELGKARSGIDKVYRDAGADSFRAAWDGAVALAERRMVERLASARSGAGAMKAPSVNRRKSPPPLAREDWGEGDEDADSRRRRAEEARDSISGKLLRARRLYLADICDSPGKRAAFEILTDLKIDWDRAGRMEPQDDEPWRHPNMRQPDMLLTAENGWLNDIAHATVPDRLASLRAALDRHYAEHGLPAIEWDGESTSPLEGEDG